MSKAKDILEKHQVYEMANYQEELPFNFKVKLNLSKKPSPHDWRAKFFKGVSTEKEALSIQLSENPKIEREFLNNFNRGQLKEVKNFVSRNWKVLRELTSKLDSITSKEASDFLIKNLK